MRRPRLRPARGRDRGQAEDGDDRLRLPHGDGLRAKYGLEGATAAAATAAAAAEQHSRE